MTEISLGAFGRASVAAEQVVTLFDSDGTEVVRGRFRDGQKYPVDLQFFGLTAADIENLPGDNSRLLRFRNSTDRPSVQRLANLWKTPSHPRNEPLTSRTELLSQLLYQMFFVLRSGAKLGDVEAADIARRRETRRLKLATLAALNPSVAAAVEDDNVNGCTWSPDGWWVECCNNHDRCYNRGGTESDRSACDDSFYNCMQATAGSVIASIYFAAVRRFGSAYFGNPDA